jgi:hypothetical protein
MRKQYSGIPGTTVFDGEQSRRGYHLNQFCMSLLNPANRFGSRPMKKLTSASGISLKRKRRRFYRVPASNTAVGHVILEPLAQPV